MRHKKEAPGKIVTTHNNWSKQMQFAQKHLSVKSIILLKKRLYKNFELIVDVIIMTSISVPLFSKIPFSEEDRQLSSGYTANPGTNKRISQVWRTDKRPGHMFLILCVRRASIVWGNSCFYCEMKQMLTVSCLGKKHVFQKHLFSWTSVMSQLVIICSRDICSRSICFCKHLCQLF